jgi:hypothetical protein
MVEIFCGESASPPPSWKPGFTEDGVVHPPPHREGLETNQVRPPLSSFPPCFDDLMIF